MKKIIASTLAIVTALVISLATAPSPAVAADVSDHVALSVGTNGYSVATAVAPSYSSIEIKKAWLESAFFTNGTATIYRVTPIAVGSAARVYTQALFTVSLTADLKNGDGVPTEYAGATATDYIFAQSTGTNSLTVVLDYVVSRP